MLSKLVSIISYPLIRDMHGDPEKIVPVHETENNKVCGLRYIE